VQIALELLAATSAGAGEQAAGCWFLEGDRVRGSTPSPPEHHQSDEVRRPMPAVGRGTLDQGLQQGSRTGVLALPWGRPIVLQHLRCRPDIMDAQGAGPPPPPPRPASHGREQTRSVAWARALARRSPAGRITARSAGWGAKYGAGPPAGFSSLLKAEHREVEPPRGSSRPRCWPAGTRPNSRARVLSQRGSEALCVTCGGRRRRTQQVPVRRCVAAARALRPWCHPLHRSDVVIQRRVACDNQGGVQGPALQ